MYFSVRVVFTRVCARVSDWPGTGRFKTIRLVNISVAGSMRSEILCYRRISTRDWKHHECRCNVGAMSVLRSVHTVSAILAVNSNRDI